MGAGGVVGGIVAPILVAFFVTRRNAARSDDNGLDRTVAFSNPLYASGTTDGSADSNRAQDTAGYADVPAFKDYTDAAQFDDHGGSGVAGYMDVSAGGIMEVSAGGGSYAP